MYVCITKPQESLRFPGSAPGQSLLIEAVKEMLLLFFNPSPFSHNASLPMPALCAFPHSRFGSQQNFKSPFNRGLSQEVGGRMSATLSKISCRLNLMLPAASHLLQYQRPWADEGWGIWTGEHRGQEYKVPSLRQQYLHFLSHLWVKFMAWSP